MAGTKQGGINAARTNKLKYGKDFYARIGRMGGAKGTTGGFFANRELASTAGRLGGIKSRRTGIPNGEGKHYSTLNKYRKEGRIS